MATVLDFLTESLEELGIVGADGTVVANDADFAFRRLNRLLDRMKAEGLLIPYPQTRTTFALGTCPADGLYTVGTGGNFNRPRPQWINGVSYYDSTLTDVMEINLGVSLTDEQYRSLPMKFADMGTFPNAYYWNPTFGSSGFASLTFYPIFTSTSAVGVLYAPSAVPEFTALSNTVSLPPGYHEFLVYEVALRLAPGFRREPSATLLKLHAGAKSTLEASNLRQSDLSLPSFGNRGANLAGFYSGWGGS